MRVFRAMLFGAIVMSASISHAADALFALGELEARSLDLAETYFAQFQHRRTFVLYGAKLSTKENWTTPEEVKSRKPAPWGWVADRKHSVALWTHTGRSAGRT